MSNISATVVVISSTGGEYSIPGDISPEAFIASYGTQINGLSNMVATTTCSDGTKYITFNPRTGTKG